MKYEIYIHTVRSITLEEDNEDNAIRQALESNIEDMAFEYKVAVTSEEERQFSYGLNIR